jgi:radical SAM protein with 4Fe4S-binding SPASM domain
MKIKLPEIAVFHINEACTHRCPMCYAGNGLGRGYKNRQGDLETLCRIVDELERFKVKTVNLLGGDPVLHTDIVKLIKYIKANTSMILEITSNTLSIENYEITELSKYIDIARTTLHGVEPFHDKFCDCEDAYKTVVDNLKQYFDCGTKVDIAYNFTTQSYNQIEQVITDLYENRGIRLNAILIQRIVGTGRAKDGFDFRINFEQLNEAFSQVDRMHKKYGFKIVIEDAFPFCAVDEKYHSYLSSCGFSTRKVPINANGDISRCGAYPHYDIGNLLVTPLDEVWEKSVTLRDFRERACIKKACQGCEHYERCLGGCCLCNNGKVDYLYNRG